MVHCVMAADRRAQREVPALITDPWFYAAAIPAVISYLALLYVSHLEALTDPTFAGVTEPSS